MKKVYLIPEIEIEIIDENADIVTASVSESFGNDEVNDFKIPFGNLK